ncbi:Uncharacterised protein [Mycobacteroides abscessus subsp. abscessus]|uniref:hypothetical protein n=1 Tax=Mycobacteroides abscessus TaxID=36809 RepID=UPI00092B679F|nr:hypothetical protein [Mycobacteroides abscessus]SHS98880.1 Uncharacterised protein [Mycobacteroides abscessus subsp. abscessus]SLK64497.1 Uncharacterised protein [Mycobacteroides abscessus subsp. abscessus]
MPTVEQIDAAAEILETLSYDGSWREAGTCEDTYFLSTADQLRRIADGRKPKAPKVFVSEDHGRDLTVYIEKPNGKYVGVYLIESRDSGYAVNNDLPFSYGEQVWGPTK